MANGSALLLLGYTFIIYRWYTLDPIDENIIINEQATLLESMFPGEERTIYEPICPVQAAQEKKLLEERHLEKTNVKNYNGDLGEAESLKESDSINSLSKPSIVFKRTPENTGAYS